jgi:hypothetical protein
VAFGQCTVLVSIFGQRTSAIKINDQTYIHEYDSKAKSKRLNFDLEFSKPDTNLLGNIT